MGYSASYKKTHRLRCLKESLVEKKKELKQQCDLYIQLQYLNVTFEQTIKSTMLNLVIFTGIVSEPTY